MPEESTREHGSAILSIFLAIVMYLLDFFVFQFKGLRLDSLTFGSIAWRSVVGIALTVLIIQFILRKRDGEAFKEMVPLYVILSIVITIVYSIGGEATLPHLVLGWGIIFALPKSVFSSREKTTILIVMYALDFFMISLLANYVNYSIVLNKLIFPIWVLYSLLAAYQVTEKGGYAALLIIIVLMYAVVAIPSLRTLNRVEKYGDKDYAEAGEFVVDMKKEFKQWGKLFDPSTYINDGSDNSGPDVTIDQEQGRIFKADFETDKVKYYIQAGTNQEIEEKLKITVKPVDSTNVEVTCDIKAYEEDTPVSGDILGNTVYSYEATETNNVALIPCKFTSIEAGDYIITYTVSSGLTVVGIKDICFMDETKLNNERVEASVEQFTTRKYPFCIVPSDSSRGPIEIGLEVFQEGILPASSSNNRLPIRIKFDPYDDDGELKQINELLLYVPSGITVTGCTNTQRGNGEYLIDTSIYREYSWKNGQEEFTEAEEIDCWLEFNKDTMGVDAATGVYTTSLIASLNYEYIIKKEKDISVHEVGEPEQSQI